MGQQQAQTNNNKTSNKTLVAASPYENNLHTVAARRPLALNGHSKGSKHNLEIPVRTEFSYLVHPTAGKQRLLSLSSVTQNGAIQAQPLNNIKPHQNPSCNKAVPCLQWLE
jgi:hypothetical protein